jgi:hypothetical protein
MARLFSNRDRPFDMGMLPTELLARDPHLEIGEASVPADAAQPGADSILAAIPEYSELCVKFFDGEVAAKRAPVADDPPARARNLRASAYFLDATLAGVCRIERSDWLAGKHPAHTHAFGFLVEFGREPKAGEPGAEWIRGTNAARTDVRCAEVAVVLAGYLRTLGWSARGHIAGETLLSIERLAQRAGVAKSINGELKAPFMQRGFRLGVVTTDFEMACDLPLASLDWPSADAYLGKLGTRPGRAGPRPQRRSARCTWAATKWSASSAWTSPPRLSCATRSSACPSAPISSRARSPATSARSWRRSAAASRSSTRSPSP